MFASLKNKIKEETGSEVAGPGLTNLPQLQPHQRSTTLLTSMNHTANNNNRLKSRFSSTISVNSNDESVQVKNMFFIFVYKNFIILSRILCTHFFNVIVRESWQFKTTVSGLKPENFRITKSS